MTSELVLHRKLDQPRIHRQPRELPETGGLIDIDGGVAELGMVEEVEELRAELERRVFSDAANTRRFRGRDIPIKLARSQNHANPAVAVPGPISHGGRRAECLRIQIAGTSTDTSDAGGQIPRRRDIGICHSGAHLRARVLEAVNRRATAVRYGERCSVLNRGQAGKIPAIDQRTHDSLALREREIPTVVHRQTVRMILWIQAILLAEVVRIPTRKIVRGEGAAPCVGCLDGKSLSKTASGRWPEDYCI